VANLTVNHKRSVCRFLRLCFSFFASPTSVLKKAHNNNKGSVREQEFPDNSGCDVFVRFFLIAPL
jgi:hypothetical protein